MEIKNDREKIIPLETVIEEHNEYNLENDIDDEDDDSFGSGSGNENINTKQNDKIIERIFKINFFQI